MLQKKVVLLFAAAGVALAGCGNDEGEAVQEGSPEVVEVESLIPHAMAVNEDAVLSIELTQGEELVEDADEVEYEIWPAADKENGEFIEGDHEGDGIYSIETSFAEPDVYYIQPHVTARGMHVMPTFEIVIGDLDEEEIEEARQAEEEADYEDMDQHEDHDQH